MSADDERDPAAATPPLEARRQHPDPDPDLLGSFDAFRARRAEERAQAEPFPQEYGAQYEQYEHEYAAPAPLPPTAPPGFEYAQQPPRPFPPAPAAVRRPWRSVAILGGAAALAVGLGAGVYAAVQPSDHARAGFSSPPAATSAPASPGSKAVKGGKAVTVRLTVTAVSTDSFTATARGETVLVHIAPQTRFGTVARPFTRSQLVPGAVVYARLRREADGTIVATVIAAAAPAGAQSVPGGSLDSPGAPDVSGTSGTRDTAGYAAAGS